MSTFGSVFVGLDNTFTVNDGGWTSFNQYPRQLGDVNGDGRDDIVGFGNDNVFVSLGQSNGTFGSVFVGLDNNFTVNDGAWTSFDKYPRQLGDVNGDGRDDIVGFGNDNVFVSLGQSNGTFGSVFVGLDNNFTVNDGGWTSFDKYPRQLGDVNGDGRDDIVGFGNDNVFVSLGQSNGTFGSVFVGLDNTFTVNDGAWSSFDKYPRQLGDVTDNGRDDIVSFGNDNVFVSLGQSNGTFGSVFVGLDNDFTFTDGAWTSFDKYPRQLGDVNGDGRDDIVGFGNDNVFVSLG
ncbi:VCBS repeat-containing protein [Nostoc sp. CHAB 5784]|uniref:FG-GAP repeat domain-containing protein n=1 Tax=Nostoc mirabile TaxID=2907820 RepID=UPI001E32A9DD|nr:VCBS repeat-containing protein [Nostoc mirabile]MCC5662813.1 VCBS repeat-containing protein [Nostoc mirabile CHAB5784]